MVVNLEFKDLFELSAKEHTLSLPAYKENVLVLNYLEDVAENNNWKVPPLPFAASDCFHARLVNSERLSALSTDCKRIYEISLDVTGKNLKWRPGDTIGVIPENDTEEVAEILQHLGFANNTSYELSVATGTKAKAPAHIPSRGTVQHIFSNCLDIRCCIKKLFLLALSRQTKEESERKVIEYLCSKEGSTAYSKYILTPHTTILDIFRQFKSCKPNMETLLAHLPRLLPRPYSIRNSQIKNESVIKVCFSVPEFNNGRTGVTTGYMEKKIMQENLEDSLRNLSFSEKSESSDISIYLRKNMSCFTLPEDSSVPLILVGPGTGVAPFIGFLEERKVQRDSNRQPGDIWLFFGCRNPDLDYLYKEELKIYLADGTLTKLNTAFSRTEDKCRYVQDAIKENAEGVVTFIRNGASVFVCGDQSDMAARVRDAFKQCFIADGVSDEEAERLITDLERNKRYYVDAWN